MATTTTMTMTFMATSKKTKTTTTNILKTLRNPILTTGLMTVIPQSLAMIGSMIPLKLEPLVAVNREQWIQHKLTKLCRNDKNESRKVDERAYQHPQSLVISKMTPKTMTTLKRKQKRPDENGKSAPIRHAKRASLRLICLAMPRANRRKTTAMTMSATPHWAQNAEDRKCTWTKRPSRRGSNDRTTAEGLRWRRPTYSLITTTLKKFWPRRIRRKLQRNECNVKQRKWRGLQFSTLSNIEGRNRWQRNCCSVR
mmetsp:Transcript_58282/g.92620  ORF Transcript_58282/g.92620 Transcript_58282/m.92620 type:complete len:254 (+) Transcript_58282:925-1686(+)